MRFPEEDYAKGLQEALEVQMVCRASRFRFTVAGAGVHWQCQGASPGRVVVIHCFEVKNAPEYYAEFRTVDRTDATARTSARHQVVAAAFDWLEGRAVEQLRAEYPVIDGQRRGLEQIEGALVVAAPSLAETTRRMQPVSGDLYELWFEKGDRDVQVSFWGESPAADFTFRWDKCKMAKVRLDDLPMAARAIEGWLNEHAAPDEMRRRFPAIPLSKVADFYAAGRPMEGEFLESWDLIEAFVRRNKWPGKRNAADMVAALRHAGYDRTLRAGQSMLTLMVSRSRRHGLRVGQPHIQISFSDSQIRMTPYLDGEPGQTIQLGQPKVTQPVAAMLDRLAVSPVD